MPRIKAAPSICRPENARPSQIILLKIAINGSTVPSKVDSLADKYPTLWKKNQNAMAVPKKIVKNRPILVCHVKSIVPTAQIG